VVVPGAFLAVREYGQRLDHALHGFEEQARAERRQRNWDVTIGPATEVFLKRGGPIGGVLEGYAAMAFGFDGRWDNGRDDGLHFDRDDASDAVLGEVPADPAVLEVLAGQARAVFDRTAEALGGPTPPEPPGLDRLGPLKDAALDAVPGEDSKRRRAAGR
jgi:hypothetical protein